MKGQRTDSGQTPVVQVLVWVLLGLAVYFCSVYLVLAVLHLQFPYALEWIEGSMLDHVRRAVSGEPIYVSPTPEFVPAIYPPLYYYCAAALAHVIGLGLLPLRLVSLAASLGSLMLIFLIVSRASESRPAGILAAGLFAATYQAGGPYLDMGRIDSLFLFFFLATVYLIRFRTSWHGQAMAGIMLACAVLTKQTALLLALPLIFCSLLFSRAAGTFAFCLTAALTAGFTSILINYVHNGWYFYYVFELPRQHPVLFSRIAGFWTQDIAATLPVACLFALAYVFLPARVRQKRSMIFFVLVTGSVLAIACLSKIKSGGFKNVLMPAHATLAMMFGLAYAAGMRLLQNWQPRAQLMARAVIMVLCAGQFGLLLYDPRGLVPDPRQARNARAVVELAANIQGEVFAPAYGYLCAMAGKRGSAHIGAINDVLRGDPGPVRQALIDAIRAAISGQRFAAIILDRRFEWFQKDIEQHYDLAPGSGRQHPAWPLVRFFYVPKQRAE